MRALFDRKLLNKNFEIFFIFQTLKMLRDTILFKKEILLNDYFTLVLIASDSCPYSQFL